MVAFGVLIPMIGSLITVEGKSEIGQCATFIGNNFLIYNKILMNLVKNYWVDFNIPSKDWLAVSNVYYKELVTQMRMARYKGNKKLDKVETTAKTFDLRIWHSKYAVILVKI